MVTLAMLLALALPRLVYSHLLSSTPTDSSFRAELDQVSPWETFEEEVAGSCATLDNSIACHRPVAFPANAD